MSTGLVWPGMWGHGGGLLRQGLVAMAITIVVTTTHSSGPSGVIVTLNAPGPRATEAHDNTKLIRSRDAYKGVRSVSTPSCSLQ